LKLPGVYRSYKPYHLQHFPKPINSTIHIHINVNNKQPSIHTQSSERISEL